MPARADVGIGPTINAHFDSVGAVIRLVETPSGVLYCVYIDSGSDVVFKKSTDGGLSWGLQTSIFAGTATAMTVWYDRWSGISAGLIHVAYQESVTDDTFYRTIDTESSDALSTQTTVFLGASTAAGGTLSITRAVGGNVYCATMIDAGTEGGFFRLPNANVPSGAWDAARSTCFEAATQDLVLLQPDFDSADNQDIFAFFWDASANEISRKNYDDSANSWAETSIATSMTDLGVASNTPFPHWAACRDLSSGDSILVAWSAVDTASARLRAWQVNNSTITALTDVVSSSTDDQGLAMIAIDDATGDLTVIYGGATGGGETFRTAINLYCKVSKDGGTTWGPETPLTSAARDIPWIGCVPRRYIQPLGVAYFHNGGTIDEIKFNVQVTQPRASHQLFGG